MSLPSAQLSSIRADGSRVPIFPSDVKGRFIRARRIVFAVLLGFYVAAPVVHLGKHAVIHLDVEQRRFWLFGGSFNAQDVWLLVLFLLAATFSTLLVTAWRGRLWCGWACPQTVFVEGLYRPIERWLEGPREKRLRNLGAPLTARAVGRKVLKHTLWVLLSLGLAHVALALFLSREELTLMVLEGPAKHPTAFLWAFALTALAYFDFAWFREQFCVVLCPYGRLQSVMHDKDSIVIGYDFKRGDPRGPVKKALGDCVDCNRCVTACPTAIDIRNGLQMECLACAQCVDACDTVMDKVGRPRGLIRYASTRELEGAGRRVLRPRLFVYAALTLVSGGVLLWGLTGRAPFEANVLRLPGPPYLLVDGKVRNAFQVHLVNKSAEPARFTLAAKVPPGATLELPRPEVELQPMEGVHLPLLVWAPRGTFTAGQRVEIEVEGSGIGLQRSVALLGPGGETR